MIVGLLSVLHEYETERQRYNLTIQTGVDLLHRLYSFELSPVVALRTLGLSFVNSSDALKVSIRTALWWTHAFQNVPRFSFDVVSVVCMGH